MIQMGIPPTAASPGDQHPQQPPHFPPHIPPNGGPSPPINVAALMAAGGPDVIATAGIEVGKKTAFSINKSTL